MQVPVSQELTEREVCLLRCLAAGMTNTQIAKDLSLSESTVEHMLSSSDSIRGVYPKIGVSNRAQAAAWYTTHFGYASLGDEDSVLSAGDLMDFFGDQVEVIRQVRIEGNPQLAIHLASNVDLRLSKAALQLASSKYFEPIQRLRAVVLYQQARAYTKILPRSQVLGTVRPIARKIRELAKICNDDEVFGLSESRIGDAFYIMSWQVRSDSGIETAMSYLYSALEHLKTSEDRVPVLRQLALSWAVLGDEARFKEVSSEAREQIEDRQHSGLDEACQTLEGLTRGYGLLGLAEDAYHTLSKATRLLDKMMTRKQRSPFRLVQLKRTELELLQRFEPENKVDLDRIGTEAAEIAGRYGYTLHKAYIEGLLARSLG